jgi:hypothetical protein
MAITLSDFITYLENEVKNGSVYVLGAQGQVYPFSDDWISQREHGNASNISRVKKTIEKRVADGYNTAKIRAFDCSGLGMYWLQNLQKLLLSDLNANGMRGQCVTIDKADVKRGDWVFMVEDGRATHIGYVVDDNGGVIEARGRDYGVVKTSVSSRPWNAYGRPKMFKTEIEMPDAIGRELKKGDKGNDVRLVQQALISKGFAMPKYGADGSFGDETHNALVAFQKSIGKATDGIAGQTEIEMLGLVWNGKTDYEKAFKELSVKYTELLEDMQAIKNISNLW